jgi:hypothetical protein
MSTLSNRQGGRKPVAEDSTPSTKEDRYFHPGGDPNPYNQHTDTFIDKPLSWPGFLSDSARDNLPFEADLYVLALLDEICAATGRTWLYHSQLSHACDLQYLVHRASLVAGAPPDLRWHVLKRSLKNLQDQGFVRTEKIVNRPGHHLTVHHCRWLEPAEKGGQS